ncbi:MAG: cadherin domain-containing protein, partial [Burkholderiaceae bacterium]
MAASACAQAILATNATANLGTPDRIEFDIPDALVAGAHTIEPTSALPQITDALVIDGTTEPDFAGTPIVVLDGNNSVVADALTLGASADGSTIRGLVIRDFTGDAIVVSVGSDGNTIVGNYIGRLDVTGADAGVGEQNTSAGIRIAGANTIVGGSLAADRNVISGNANQGIWIRSTATGTVVQGNIIGADPLGGGAVSNTLGIQVDGSFNVIGGTGAGAGNVISGNTSNGLVISGAGADGNVVQGNTIGLNAAGNAAISNGAFGVVIDLSADNTQLGGTVAGAGNVISGNTGTTGSASRGGVYINAANTVVEGNIVGMDATGSFAIANGEAGGSLIGGIVVTNGTGPNRIGGSAVGAGNLIAGNLGAGVAAMAGLATDLSVLGNAIYGNASIGIDLEGDGVSINDAEDVDAGANGLLNVPVVTAVTQNGANLDIDFWLDVPAGTYRIEFFENPAGADASGFGEGQVLLGAVTVSTTGAAGYESFARTLAGVTPSQLTGISATATVDLGGGNYGATSEFGPVYNGGGVIVDTTADTADGNTASIAALLADRGADGRISLREAITAANNSANGASPDLIRFDIPDPLVAGAQTILPTSALPWITDAVIIDATTEPDFAGTPIVELDGSLAGAGVDGLYIDSGANGTEIRGLVINRFSRDGIQAWSGNLRIAGNYIGTDVSGLVDLGNGADGLRLTTNSSTIGGTIAADRNVIAGNGGTAIRLANGADNNIVVGNYLGVGADGMTAVGNDGNGIWLGINNPSGNRIGGTLPGEGNVIANGGGVGIGAAAGTGTNNAILGNRIFANANTGIDLAADGVTANDADDVDTGPNALLNFPVLTAAAGNGATSWISGSYQGLATTTLRIEFFASTAADASGYGEAERYLGFTTITTDAVGNASFSYVALPAGTLAGEVVSATATVDLGGGNYGSSSEFAQSITVADTGPALSLDVDDSSGAGAGNFATTFTENGGPTIIADADAAIADPDSVNLASMTVTITNLLDGASEVLAANTGGTAITASYNPGTGVLTISGADTLANYQQVLRTVSYDNSSENPSTAARLVEFVASDGVYASAAVTSTVSITALNDAPVITSDGGGATAGVNVAENVNAVTLVTSIDVDGGAPNYTIAGGADAAFFTIDNVSGALSFLAARDYESPLDAGTDNVYDVTVQVDDGLGGIDTQAIRVTVTPVNDNDPVITSDGGGASASVNVAENTTAVTTVVATDADLPAQTMNYSIVGGADAALFTIDGVTGALSFLAAPDYEAPADAGTDNVYDVTVQADDGLGGTDTQAISVTVTPVNDNDPVITSDGGGATASVSVTENTTAVTTVTATDADLPAQTMNYSIVGGADAALFTIDGVTGALSFLAAPDYEGPADTGADNVYDVTVQADDGAGRTDTQAIAVSVTPVNDNPPVITSDGGGASASLNVAENATAVTTVTATDADRPAQAMNYSIVGGPDAALFTLDSVSGALRFTTAPDYEAPADANTDNVYELIVQADDGNGGTDTQAISVAVTPIDDTPPIITSDGGGASASLAVAENTTAVTVVTAIDGDTPASPVSVSIEPGADAARFSLDPVSGTLRFLAAPDFESPTDANADGVYVLTVRALDASGDSVTQTLQITVTDVNEAPTDLVLLRANAITAPTAPYGTIRVTDPDSGETFAFVLDDDALGRFVLDPASGTLAASPAAANVLTTGVTYRIVVTATDSAGHPITRAIRFEIPPITDTTTPPGTTTIGSTTDPSGTHPNATPFIVDAPDPGTKESARETSVPAPGSIPRDRLDVPLEISRDGGSVDEPAARDAEAASNQRAARSQRVGIGDERPRVLDTTTLALLLSLDSLVGPGFEITSLSDIPEWITERYLIRRGEIQFHVDGAASASQAMERDSGNRLEQLLNDPITMTGAVLSASLVWWAARAGGILTSLMVGAPSWRSVDLLPVVMSASEDDAAETIDPPSSGRSASAQGSRSRRPGLSSATPHTIFGTSRLGPLELEDEHASRIFAHSFQP